MIKELTTLDAKAIADTLNDMLNTGMPIVLARHSLQLPGGVAHFVPSMTMPLVQGSPIICMGDTVYGTAIDPSSADLGPVPLAGSVVLGSPTVFLNGRPVAHVGAMVAHNLGNAPITEGLFSPVDSSDVVTLVGLGL